MANLTQLSLVHRLLNCTSHCSIGLKVTSYSFHYTSDSCYHRYERLLKIDVFNIYLRVFDLMTMLTNKSKRYIYILVEVKVRRSLNRFQTYSLRGLNLLHVCWALIVLMEHGASDHDVFNAHLSLIQPFDGLFHSSLMYLLHQSTVQMACEQQHLPDCMLKVDSNHVLLSSTLGFQKPRGACKGKLWGTRDCTSSL